MGGGRRHAAVLRRLCSAIRGGHRCEWPTFELVQHHAISRQVECAGVCAVLVFQDMVTGGTVAASHRGGTFGSRSSMDTTHGLHGRFHCLHAFAQQCERRLGLCFSAAIVITWRIAVTATVSRRDVARWHGAAGLHVITVRICVSIGGIHINNSIEVQVEIRKASSGVNIASIHMSITIGSYVIMSMSIGRHVIGIHMSIGIGVHAVGFHMSISITVHSGISRHTCDLRSRCWLCSRPTRRSGSSFRVVVADVSGNGI